jgi:hypothetical protein
MTYNYFVAMLFSISSSGTIISLFILMSIFITSNVQAINLIIGTTNRTVGTQEDDVVIGCSSSNAGCSQGDFLFGLEADDSLQGSSADDWLFGDKDNDQLSGGDGNDKLFGGDGKDILQGGFGGDLLFGGSGNDELYAGPGDDMLIGGPGMDYFDCGDGHDIIVDFDPKRGDTSTDNCEVALTNNPNDIQVFCDDILTSSIINSTMSTNNVMSARSILSTSLLTSGFTCNGPGPDYGYTPSISSPLASSPSSSSSYDPVSK